MSNDHYLDAHTYQPLVQRTSMGNIYSSSKSTSSVESGNRCNDNAPQLVTGTKGLLFNQQSKTCSVVLCVCVCYYCCVFLCDKTSVNFLIVVLVK